MTATAARPDRRPASHVVLVLGDPFVTATALAEPLAKRLPADIRIVRHDWDISFEAAVAVNREIEAHGPDAAGIALDVPVAGEDVLGVVTQFHPVTAAMIATWPRLRFVATLRAGTENLDLAAATAAGATVIDNAGRNANAVAEFTVAAMLGHLRRIGENHHMLRTGAWRAEPPPAGYRELAGQTVGLIGFGAVGSLVPRRLSGFDCRILVHDPWTQVRVPGIEAADQETLLRTADVVSLHARLTSQTHGLIGPAELDLMRPTALLVNTARAELVEEPALLERLRDGRLGGAALDVFAVEPLPPHHPLRSLPNVSLSPHLAGATAQARQRAPRLLADRIIARMFDG